MNNRIDLTQFNGNNLDTVTLTEKATYDVELDQFVAKNTEPGIPTNIPDGIVFAPPPPGELARVEWLGHRTGWIQIEDARVIAAVPDLIAELKRCYEREDIIIRALKDVWIGNTCWHQPSEHLEDIAETRGSTLGHIASLLQVDVNRQDIHDLEYGCGGENCEHNASE